MKTIDYIIAFLCGIAGSMLFMLTMNSCTISFQNIDTHGTATDLVDENQATSPNISPVITVPVNAVPEIPIK